MSILNSEDFIFNGVDIAPHFSSLGFLFTVNDTKGRGLISQDAKTVTVSGADGSRVVDVVLPEREITVDYTLRANSLSELREAEGLLSSLLVFDEPKQLSFKDQKGYFNALYVDVDITLERDKVQQGTLKFICPEPYRFGDVQTLSSKTLNANTPLIVTSKANYISGCVFTVAVKSSASSFIFKVGNQTLTYSNSVSTADKFVIDSVEKSVTLNGKLKVLELSGEIPSLASGNNTITLNVNSELSYKYMEQNI